MAINFKEIAIKESTLSHLMIGKEQLKTEDVLNEPITLTEFDIVAINGKKTTLYPVFLVKEKPDHYLNGGFILMKFAQAWAAAAGGDVETASNELKRAGGVKIKAVASRTKSGNNLTTVEILD